MATSAQYLKVLRDKEEELVHVLSLKDPMEVANNLFKIFVISDTMRDRFASLDHSSVEPQLEIRYLLRLVCERLEGDGTVWYKFLNLLPSMGTTFNTVRKKLQDQLERTTGSVGAQASTSAASGEADAILTSEDAEDITELLAEIAY